MLIAYKLPAYMPPAPVQRTSKLCPTDDIIYEKFLTDYFGYKYKYIS